MSLKELELSILCHAVSKQQTFLINYIEGTCARCGYDVIGKLTEAQSKNWHPECFLCDGCRNVLDGNFFIENGIIVVFEYINVCVDKPLCDACHGNQAVKCASCGGPITEGSYIAACGKVRLCDFKFNNWKEFPSTTFLMWQMSYSNL